MNNLDIQPEEYEEKYLFTAQSFLSPEVIVEHGLTKQEAQEKVDKMKADYAEFFRVRSHSWWEKTHGPIPETP